MAAYTDDYKNLLPTNGNIPISVLIAMNTNEINKGTAANNAYATGWIETANFSAYKSSTSSGIKNYMAKTFGHNT